MNKYEALIILLIFSVSITSCSSKKAKPNILFIAIDDLRPELGAYGNKVVQSPNLDRLANEGFLFNNHFVQVPTCGASRYSMLTGMRPVSRAHLKNNIFEHAVDGIEKEIPETFVHHLKRNGYRTVGIGKITHSVDGFIYGYTEKPSERKELPLSWDEFLFDSNKWGTGWNAFFGYADGSNRQGMKRQVKPYEKGAVEDDGYPDGIMADMAIAKLKELKNQDKPFFLGLGFFKPHLPFNSPAKYWDLYDPEEIPISKNKYIPKNVHKSSLHKSGEINGYHLTDEKASLEAPVSDEYMRKLTHAYYACVSYTDAQVGKVLDELKSLGLEENTIVVVWGDHGWHLGDQQIWAKHTVFENSLRSAFMIKVPGKNGNTIDDIVESVDIYPTLLELCGVSKTHKTDGNSLLPLLNGQKESNDGVAYGYYRNGISVRNDRYRLSKYFREEMPNVELYDHETDPMESVNIAAENPDIVKALMPLLEKGNTGLYSSK